VAFAVAQAVLALAVVLVRRRSQYLGAGVHGASEVLIDVTDVKHHSGRPCSAGRWWGQGARRLVQPEATRPGPDLGVHHLAIAVLDDTP
jgi:hypothetical protein